MLEGIRHGSPLRYLNLNGNHIGEEGGLALAGAMRAMQKLEELHCNTCNLRPCDPEIFFRPITVWPFISLHSPPLDSIHLYLSSSRKDTAPTSVASV